MHYIKDVCRTLFLVLIIAAFCCSSLPVFGEETKTKLYDIMFVLDNSKSVKESDFLDERKNIICNVLDAFSGCDNIQVGCITYSDAVHQENIVSLAPIASTEEYLSAIESAPIEGHTNTGAALEYAANSLNNHGRQNAEKQIFLFTDGECDMGSPDANAESINKLLNTFMDENSVKSDIQLYSIMLGADNFDSSISELVGDKIDENLNKRLDVLDINSENKFSLLLDKLSNLTKGDCYSSNDKEKIKYLLDSYIKSLNEQNDEKLVIQVNCDSNHKSSCQAGDILEIHFEFIPNDQLWINEDITRQYSLMLLSEYEIKLLVTCTPENSTEKKSEYVNIMHNNGTFFAKVNLDQVGTYYFELVADEQVELSPYNLRSIYVGEHYVFQDVFECAGSLCANSKVDFPDIEPLYVIIVVVVVVLIFLARILLSSQKQSKNEKFIYIIKIKGIYTYNSKRSLIKRRTDLYKDTDKEELKGYELKRNCFSSKLMLRKRYKHFPFYYTEAICDFNESSDCSTNKTITRALESGELVIYVRKD